MVSLEKLIAKLFILLGSLYTIAGALWCYVLFLISKKAGFFGHYLWGAGLCRLMGVRITTVGMANWDPEGTYIICSNHSSIWDIGVLASLNRPYAWISKAEIGRVPFMGPAMRRMGCYFIKRDRSAKDLNVMRAVEEGLRVGGSVVMFPEGTRARDGKLQPLKKGAFRLAQASGRPLLPVGIFGTFPIAPPGSLFTGRGHSVVVKVGKPFPIKAFGDLKQDICGFENELKQLVQDAQTIWQKG